MRCSQKHFWYCHYTYSEIDFLLFKKALLLEYFSAFLKILLFYTTPLLACLAPSSSSFSEMGKPTTQ